LKYITGEIIGRVATDGEGSLPVSCERRLERADSGYWDEEWANPQEFELTEWTTDEDEH